MSDINEIILKSKAELIEYFAKKPFTIWKEEDLQSYLYHRILCNSPELLKRLHREYPIHVSSFTSKFQKLDLAITNETSSDITLEETLVEYAIEIKYQSPWNDVLSPRTLGGFETECKGDCNKLSSNAINFDDDINKYFFAFRLTNELQIEDVKKIFDEINWGDINYCYVECYTNNSKPNIIES